MNINVRRHIRFGTIVTIVLRNGYKKIKNICDVFKQNIDQPQNN